MFLNDDELYDLTEYKPSRPDKQIEFLREHGYPFEISSKGRPKVLRSYVEKRLGGTVGPSPAREPKLRL